MKSPEELGSIIDGNIRAYYTLFWDTKRVLSQDEKEIDAFNRNLWVDRELEVWLQSFEKWARRLVFKKRIRWSLRHPVLAYRIIRENPQFLFDLKYNA